MKDPQGGPQQDGRIQGGAHSGEFAATSHVCQGTLSILPHSVDVSEHADDQSGNSRLVVTQEVVEDKVHHPLAVSQISRRLL